MKKHAIATLGGGCFWCLEAAFRELPGVTEVISGYAGGDMANPDYESVCSGTSGHAEVVQITYYPEQISYEQLLEFFWKIHDPTTVNRQGADRGTQYRSIILHSNAQQRHQAVASRQRLDESGLYSHPSVTEIVPLEAFFRAEDYHQRYYQRNPNAGYCRVVIGPKLARATQLATQYGEQHE